MAALLIGFSFPLYLLINSLPGSATGDSFYGQPMYTGGESCKECHQKEFELWKGSDHDLAMAHATEESVLGDFSDAVFNFRGEEHRFYKRDGRFFAYTSGPDGKMGEFEVTYTFGYRPHQQYLVPFEGGQLQCLPRAGNIEGYDESIACRRHAPQA